MSEFTLFNEALSEYTKQNMIPTIEKDPCQDGCTHENTINEKGIHICTDCGEEVGQQVGNNKGWRTQQSDSKYMSDTNRVQIRKVEDRSIYKDVENLGFSESIVSKANKIYSQVTKGKIFRGNSRKAIVTACIFHAYKLSGHPQSHEKLIQIFGLSRKTCLKGLKHVNTNVKDPVIRTTHITPVNLVDEIMDQFEATDEQKKEVIALYSKIKNKSSRINRARPQSISAGLVYYWIYSEQKDISLKDFVKKIGLSELTVGRIAKEIASVLGKPDLFKN